MQIWHHSRLTARKKSWIVPITWSASTSIIIIRYHLHYFTLSPPSPSHPCHSSSGRWRWSWRTLWQPPPVSFNILVGCGCFKMRKPVGKKVRNTFGFPFCQRLWAGGQHEGGQGDQHGDGHGGRHNFTILTRFYNFDQISQFRPDFTILIKFHNFDQNSQFQPNFTISTKIHNFNQISQFQPNFTMLDERVGH